MVGHLASTFASFLLEFTTGGRVVIPLDYSIVGSEGPIIRFFVPWITYKLGGESPARMMQVKMQKVVTDRRWKVNHAVKNFDVFVPIHNNLSIYVRFMKNRFFTVFRNEYLTFSWTHFWSDLAGSACLADQNFPFGNWFPGKSKIGFLGN